MKFTRVGKTDLSRLAGKIFIVVTGNGDLVACRLSRGDFIRAMNFTFEPSEFDDYCFDQIPYNEETLICVLEV